MLAPTRFLPHRRHRFKPAGSSRGFSITELLVVIGIIVLLAGLLLVALGKARSRALETTTLSTMQALARACDTFQGDHGFYPGVIPERVLAEDPKITGTQNALLHLLGGYRVLTPIEVDAASGVAWDEFEQFRSDSTSPVESSGNEYLEFEAPGGGTWRLVIDLDRIGEGPFINNRPYATYLSVSGNELRRIGMLDEDDVDIDDLLPHDRLPHLVDAWGQPIVYLRQIRTNGRLVGDATTTDSAERPQFTIQTARRYFNATTLGDKALDQTQLCILSDEVAGGDEELINLNLAQLIRHPAFGPREVDDSSIRELTARGAYVLISAGADAVYFSRFDGAGRPGNPVDNIAEDDGDYSAIPTIVSEYDDVVVFGGG